jgi:hypothetical protein
MKRTKRILRWLVPIAFVAAAIGGIGVWIVYPYFSFAEMFRRSKPALESYAAQVMAPGSNALMSPPKRIGYFGVLKVEPLPNGFLFQHDQGNPFDWNGLAYSTNPLPEVEKDSTGKVKEIFTPLGGNWYDVFRP